MLGTQNMYEKIRQKRTKDKLPRILYVKAKDYKGKISFHLGHSLS